MNTENIILMLIFFFAWLIILTYVTIRLVLTARAWKKKIEPFEAMLEESSD